MGDPVFKKFIRNLYKSGFRKRAGISLDAVLVFQIQMIGSFVGSIDFLIGTVLFYNKDGHPQSVISASSSRVSSRKCFKISCILLLLPEKNQGVLRKQFLL